MIENEKGLLSCILMDNEILYLCKVTDKHLENTEHKSILNAMRALIAEGLEVVASVLAGRSGVDVDYIYELMSYTITPIHWETYWQAILENFNKKFIGKIIKKAEFLLQDPEVSSQEILSKIIDIKLDIEKREDSLFPGIYETFDLIYKKGESTFLAKSTGYPSLDLFLGGIRAGALYIIGARPGVGKSTLMLNICLKSPLQSCILSTEMSAKEIHLRTMCYASGVSQYKIERAMQEQEVSNCLLEFQEKTVGIYDTFMFEDIEGIIAKEVAKGTKLIFVDYLQQIRSRHRYENTNTYIGKITGLLKAMALKYKIAIVCLAQLNRQASEGQPTLAHLRDSGNIEQDADAVMLLGSENGLTDFLVVHVAKNRQGQLGQTRLLYEKEIYQITNC